MPGEYDILRSILSDRPIAFHPQLARVFGGINEALLFQQLAYWSDKGADPDWIFKTQKEIEEETTLTRTQQENARKKLRSLGVIAENRRGVPAKLYFRVIWPEVFARLEAAIKDAGNPHSRMRGSSTQVRGEDADQSAPDLPAIAKSTNKEELQREDFEVSKGQPIRYDKDRGAILPYVEDIAREFADQAPLSSSVTRALNLFRESGTDLDQFVELMLSARAITKERSASIKTEVKDDSAWPKKNKMSYWFSVLTDLCGLRSDKKSG